MRVLITGGAGFIGSHLSDALLDTGKNVTVLDDLSTGKFGNLAYSASKAGFRFVEGDIRDRAIVDAAISGADIAVHLAARIGMRAVVASPLETMEINAHGTECVLEAAVSAGVPVVIASTSEVYGSSTKIPSEESDPICFGSPTVGRWSYACTKAYDEFYAMALHRERGLPVAVVRLFNTVGVRQLGRYGMVLPRFVAQAMRGEPLTVYGDGLQTRCFCSVSDVVNGLLTIIDRMDRVNGEVFNLGNPEEITILHLAQKVIEVAASSSGIEFVPFSQAYPEGFQEIMRRVPDITKAAAMLDFRPALDLHGILSTVIASMPEKEVAV